MFRRSLLAAAWLCLAGVATATAQTVEVNGVKFSQNLALAGAPLQLNGAGTRYKAIFKVYAAALYLPAKAATPEAVLSTPGPKRMQRRDAARHRRQRTGQAVHARHGRQLVARGVRQDDRRHAAAGRHVRGAGRSSSKRRSLHDRLRARPSAPSSLINGQPQGEPVEEPEFFNALMRIWLGRSPADLLLKNALLGISTPERLVGG